MGDSSRLVPVTDGPSYRRNGPPTVSRYQTEAYLELTLDEAKVRA